MLDYVSQKLLPRLFLAFYTRVDDSIREEVEDEEKGFSLGKGVVWSARSLSSKGETTREESVVVGTVEKRMENAEREEKVVGSRHGWPRITARLPASSSGIVGPVSS